MTCSQDLIEAYLDEELDATQRAEVERHLAACQACSEAYSGLSRQRADIKAGAPYYNAPVELRHSIRNALQREGKEGARPQARELPWRGLAIAASLLLVTSVSWNLLQLRPEGAQSDLADNVVADHIRSLIGTHLVDVASSDQHTVKPWFAGKLDFSPAVKDLESDGFPLAGGRVDYLGGRRVAALIYRRRLHVINLFIWPSNSSESKTSVVRDGYNLLHWTHGSMTYWAVSDVNAAELENLRNLLEGTATPPPH